MNDSKAGINWTKEKVELLKSLTADLKKLALLLEEINDKID